MKKLVWLCLMVALGLAGCALSGPYRTVQEIKAAVKERDEAKLAENVDFPLLRQNLKAQASAAVTKKLGLGNSGLAGAIAGSLGGAVIGGAIDYFVTPQGLAELMSGEYKSLIAPPRRAPPDDPIASENAEHQRRSEKLFKDARYGFDSPSQFSIWAMDQRGKETQFVLTRDGLKWRLTNIILADYL